jgi:hypothetical protein
MSNPENMPMGSHRKVSPWWALIWVIGGLFALLAIPALVWNPFSGAVPPPDPGKKPEDSTQGSPWFEDVTQTSAIRFQHFDSATPRHLIHETMGSGIAWIDYDVDGWPDLFCVQSCPLQGERPADLTSKLFRNNQDGSFTDVSERVGLNKVGFGMGAAVGDFDNDGFPDLLVTYLGDMALYHNQPAPGGSRRLVDIADAAGLKNPHWGTSAAWGDIDQDGDLDLYVCNYCEVDLAKYPICEDSRTKVAMCCPPSHFPAVAHKLFRNKGDLTFTDVSVESGVTAPSPAPGLAVAMVDLDADGRLDIYVANDMKPAFLFHNQGGGRFVEKALASGCALGLDGSLVAGMGIAVGDVDDSGFPSIFVTNFEKKPNILFLNRGNLNFRESSMRSGLGGPSIPFLKFGTEFLDADLDGNLDVVVANGHIHRAAKQFADNGYPQNAQIFRGLGSAKFVDVSARSGEYFSTPKVGRGIAVADYNRDGLPDLAFSNVGDGVKLLRNATRTANAGISLDLIPQGSSAPCNAVGARVVAKAGESKKTFFVVGGGSYLSGSEQRILLGLGSASQLDALQVIWPSGRRQDLSGTSLRTGAAFRIKEGSPAEAFQGTVGRSKDK